MPTLLCVSLVYCQKYGSTVHIEKFIEWDPDTC